MRGKGRCDLLAEGEGGRGSGDGGFVADRKMVENGGKPSTWRIYQGMCWVASERVVGGRVR